MIFENFEISLVLLGQFQNFQKCTRTIYLKSPFQTCDYEYKFKLEFSVKIETKKGNSCLNGGVWLKNLFFHSFLLGFHRALYYYTPVILINLLSNIKLSIEWIWSTNFFKGRVDIVIVMKAKLGLVFPYFSLWWLLIVNHITLTETKMGRGS